MEAAIYATVGLLFVAVLSGLGFLAVHYPKTFNSLGASTSLLAAVPCVGYFGYVYGLSYGSRAAMAFVHLRSYRKHERLWTPTN